MIRQVNLHPRSKPTKSHSNFYLGIDPGRDGAAVLLRGPVAVVACSWKIVRRKKTSVFQFKIATPDRLESIEYLPRASSLGFDIAHMVSAHCDSIPCIGIEDVYVGRNVKSSITLARMCGMICAPLEQTFFTEASRVMAPEWRQVVLGLKRNIKRDVAKRSSLSMIPLRVKMMPSILTHLGSYDHITDAAGIAEWVRLKGDLENGSDSKKY